jgi:hypothetical protein
MFVVVKEEIIMEPKSDEEFKVCPFNTSLMVSKSGIVKGGA